MPEILMNELGSFGVILVLLVLYSLGGLVALVLGNFLLSNQTRLQSGAVQAWFYCWPLTISAALTIAICLALAFVAIVVYDAIVSACDPRYRKPPLRHELVAS